MQIAKQVKQQNITNNKNELRKMFKKIRKEKFELLKGSPEVKEFIDKKLEEKMQELIDKFQNKGKSDEIYVSCYYPIGSELDCFSILQKLKERQTDQCDKRKIVICLPKVIENKRIMKFFEYSGEESLEIGKFNIKEPDDSVCKEVIPNIIFTPLLAFDYFKDRLGYGKGHFDNTINHLHEINHNFISVGVGYDEQFYNKKLPTDDFDKPLNYVITPSFLL